VRTSSSSIRTHLLLLVLAGSIPFATVVGLSIYHDVQQTVASTKTALRAMARSMVSNTGGKIADARQTLESLAQRPLVQKMDASRCDPVLQGVHLVVPGFTNISYANREGELICAALPPRPGQRVSFAQTAWFQEAMQEKRFTYSLPYRGPITNKWVLVLAEPVLNQREEAVGTLQLPLDLEAFDPRIPADFLPANSHYGFFSADGILIWRNVDPGQLIGSRPLSRAAQRVGLVRDGEFVDVSSDGVERFFSVVTMPHTGWIAYVGVPADQVYAAARQRAITAGVIALVAMAMLIWLALHISRRIVRPIRRLERAAHAVERGHLDVRAAVDGPREIASVAQGFNTMMEAQQRHVDMLKGNVDELRIAATAFEGQEGMMVTDANYRILRANRAMTEITGYTAEELIGHTPKMLRADGKEPPGFYEERWRTVMTEGRWQGEVLGRRKNGETYPRWLTITAVYGDDGAVTHLVTSESDITARKAAEEEITRLAFFDPLTLLPNRRLLMDRLQQALAASARSQRHGALMFIDLDHFKTLNDTLGHLKGDELLKQVAQRLTGCIREGDTVARLGGDEFVVMLEALSASAEEAATQAEQVGEKILTALRQPYLLDGQEKRSTPSIGVALFIGHEVSIEDLLKQADLAMYQSKTQGRNTLHFFDPRMQALVAEHAAQESSLREAVRAQQFVLHYQPQIQGQDQVAGVEALVRWMHPQRGLVSPAEFIPLAEETGLILPLGLWVLEAACAQLALWARRPETAQLIMSVNISVSQLRQADFVDDVLATLRRTGANPQRLKLELTESLLVTEVESTITKMNALKAQGVGFSLDDFGTGYSSLSYLKRLPLDQLKIDQSFVRDILVDPNDAAIARMVVVLADSLGLAVLAEGVEDVEQRDFLARLGCHAYQGYLFSRPLPLPEFEAFLRRGLAGSSLA
jgi:diguanylate cyclase (GGDEF)-like protein/PAS domain S-box-containing protein